MSNKRIGLIDISTILHPIRLAKARKNFGVSILQKVLELKEKLQLEEIILVRDYGKSRVRMELFPEYKAHRGLKELTAEENDRLNLMKVWSDNLHLFNFIWKVVYIPNIEADDIIGLLYQDLKADYEVLVCTSDKDIQNVIPHSNLYNIGKNRYFNVEDRKGLSKNKFLLFQILAGDTADNIPSIVGEKTAIILADNFSTFKEMKEYKEDISLLKGVSSYNKRYVAKFLDEIQKEGNWDNLQERLRLNHKLVNIFKDKAMLNETELEDYEKLLRHIKEGEIVEFNISDKLESFLEDVNETEILNLLEDIF